MAHATGNKYLIPLKYDVVHDTAQATYSDEVAFRLGVGVISNEWGDMGITDPLELEAAHRGLINVMRTIGMLEGEYFVNTTPIYLLNEKNLKSNSDGIYYPLVDKAQYVTKGTLLGYLTDYWGKTIEEYHSPNNGMVVHVRKAPAIEKGNIVVRVAEVSDKYEE
jgi:hypothetical protein